MQVEIPPRVSNALPKDWRLFNFITMKTNYSTIILRYIHDVVTGEFANIGVVVYAPDQRFLEARFTTSYERLNAVFLKIDHLHFRALMRYMSNRFDEIAADIRDGLHVPP